jgi:hypothetical protein
MANQEFPPAPPLPAPDSGPGPFPSGPPPSGIPPSGPKPRRNLVPWLAGGVVVILAVIVAAIALTSSKERGPGPGPTGGSTQPGSAIPAGFELHRLDADGFVIAIPSDWTVSSPTNQFVKFLAGDRGSNSVSEGFAANVNVVAQEVPAGTTLESYVTLNVDQLEGGQAGFDITTQIERTPETLPAGSAERLHYQAEGFSGGQNVIVVQTQHYILNGTTAYVITVTSTPSQESTFGPIFDQIVQTFQFV